MAKPATINASDALGPGIPNSGAMLGSLLVAFAISLPCVSCKTESVSVVHIEVLDADDRPVPCRVHLRAADGTVWKSTAWPAFDDHFVISGSAALPLAAGQYRYEIERGPEFEKIRGTLRSDSILGRHVRLHLRRIVDLPAQGWYPGDLHVHRLASDVPLLMTAEDLYVAPVITWWNSLDTPAWTADAGAAAIEDGRLWDSTGGEDERVGGALLYFRLDHPLSLPPTTRNEKGQIIHKSGDERDEYPCPAAIARQAQSQGPSVHIDIEKPFWWDVPTWVGLGIGDSISIAYNQMTRAYLHNGEAWGKPRDAERYSGPLGDAYWAQDIYYRILNAGIRLAPSAGSASGALPNPVGYDRVYVHVGEHLDYDAWWRGLKAGHSFVTNGPLLLVKANGELPGHVFASKDGSPLEVAVEGRVFSNEPTGRVELVRNGHTIQIGVKSADGEVSFSPMSFDESGWFLVRTIDDLKNNFRFASTAPFYVEVPPNTRRISRSAVQFFIDWIEERVSQLRAGSIPADKLESVLAFHREALEFWRRQLGRVNAE